MVDLSEFEDIRPYSDEEAVQALGRVSRHPMLPIISKYLFPKESPDTLAKTLRKVRSIDEFQAVVMVDVINAVLARTAEGFTFSGMENLSSIDGKFLAISNHRDIVLDPALILYAMHASGLPFIDNMITLISSENFGAKNELLNCLISLILGAENLFNPFAKLVFNTILDFLTNEDWIKRKLSLNIIYILSLYCKNEIITLKEHIINIIDVLKKDKVKEIRDICQLISQIYIQEEKEGKITKKRNKHLSSGNIINNNNRKGKINYIKYNNITSFSPYKTINNIKNKIHNLTTTKNFINFIKTPQRIKSQEKKRKSSFNSNSSLSDFNNKNNKFINKKKNFSFVNEKMVIKPDPNKSIFNTRKNMAFFRQNNKSDKKNKNLIIISNKEEDNDIKKNYNTFEGFYKEEKNNSIIEENIKKINKDYDNNKESINKLISLDAKIKKENIKKFEDKNIRDKNLIKSLLSEVNDLSNKQISLLDLMEEIQTNTQSQIEELNIKIFNLDNTIKELDEELYILQNNE